MLSRKGCKRERYLARKSKCAYFVIVECTFAYACAIIASVKERSFLLSMVTAHCQTDIVEFKNDGSKLIKLIVSLLCNVKLKWSVSLGNDNRYWLSIIRSRSAQRNKPLYSIIEDCLRFHMLKL